MLPRPLAAIGGPTFKGTGEEGKEGRGGEWEGKGRERGRKREGRRMKSHECGLATGLELNKLHVHNIK